MDYKADPRRIQYRKGLQMPAKCIYAARPSPWGNPSKVKPYQRFAALQSFAFFAIERLQQWDQYGTWLDPIINADYAACWCKLNEPCHVDLLFAFADLIVVQSQLFVSSLAQGFTPEQLQQPAKRHREMHWAEMILAIPSYEKSLIWIEQQTKQPAFDPSLDLFAAQDKLDMPASIVLATNLRRCADSLIATAERIMKEGE